MSVLEQGRAQLAPQIQALSDRWERMSRNDQVVWMALGGLSAVVVVVFGLWLPSSRAAENARSQYENYRSQLSYIQANMGRVQSAGGASAASGEPLLSVVNNSAASNGFTLRRFEPEGERVHIWLDGVDFNRIAAWLDQLSKQGINPVSAELERDQTTGLVTVNITLSR